MIFSKGMIIAIGVAAVVVLIIGYLGIHSLVPVNGNSPVFALQQIPSSKVHIHHNLAIHSLANLLVVAEIVYR